MFTIYWQKVDFNIPLYIAKVSVNFFYEQLANFLYPLNEMAKCSEILRLLMKNGWLIERQKGSHIVLVHSQKTNKIVFPNHGSAEMKTGTLRAMLRQAGLDKGDKRKK